MKTKLKYLLIELGVYKYLHILFGNKKSIYSLKELFNKYYTKYATLDGSVPPPEKLEKLFWKWRFHFGIKPAEFFYYTVWQFKKYNDCPWILEHVRLAVCKSVNPQVLYDCLNDKAKTCKEFHSFFGRKFFYYNNDISNEENLSLFNEFHDKIGDEIIIKKPYGMEGSGVTKVTLSHSSNEKADLWKKVSQNGYLLEEVLIQHKDIAALNPSSINTLRVLTYYNNDNVKIIYALMRIGRIGNFVDSAGQGGLFVPVDLESGTICGDGKTLEFETYEYHPDSKIKLNGYKLPINRELMQDFVNSLHKTVASINVNKCIIGWDISIREDGTPVMIEGNGSADSRMPQLVFGKPLKETYLNMKSGTL